MSKEDDARRHQEETRRRLARELDRRAVLRQKKEAQKPPQPKRDKK